MSSRAAFRYAEGTSVCSSGRRSTPPLLNAEGQTKKEEVKELLKTNAHLKVLLFAVGLLTVVSSRAGEDGIIEIRKNPQPQTSDVVVLSGPVIITNLFGDIRNRNIGAHNIRVVCPVLSEGRSPHARAARLKEPAARRFLAAKKIAMTVCNPDLLARRPPRFSGVRRDRAEGWIPARTSARTVSSAAWTECAPDCLRIVEAYGMTLNPMSGRR